MPPKTSAQLDREIKEALAERVDIAKSRRLGSRAVYDELALTNFAFGNISDETAKLRLRRDMDRIGADAIDDDAWLAGWREALSRERDEYDLNRPREPYMPLAGLGSLFRK